MPLSLLIHSVGLNISQDRPAAPQNQVIPSSQGVEGTNYWGTDGSGIIIVGQGLTPPSQDLRQASELA